MKKGLLLLASYCVAVASSFAMANSSHAAETKSTAEILGIGFEMLEASPTSFDADPDAVTIIIETPTHFASTDANAVGSCKSWKGIASTYGGRDGLAGKPTAAGHCMLPYAETPRAAMREFHVPLGAKITVHCGGKEIAAAVDDRGPYVGKRILDASPKIANYCGFTESVRQVKVTWCGEIDRSVLGGTCSKGKSKSKAKKRTRKV